MDILFLGLSIAAMIFARRWKNTSKSAGEQLAGWGFILFAICALLKFAAAYGG
ncbi:hypothetical protein LCGC14_0969940 [marine sediment metagenome]|uniref:Uncharacterized protein n=1 Tax=marine sediment metagenome TaxID=412755 RepID=A0A0F9NC25_9ZZZZ